MAELLAPLAEATLIGGFQIVFEAIDPNTGATVTGVKVSNVAVYGETPDAAAGGGGSGGTPAVPLFVPLPNGLLNG